MKLCALVIGHKKSSPGAVNKTSGVTEFIFNDLLAQEIEREATGVSIQRVYRRTYNSLPGDINELHPDFIVSLHCNAFDTKVSGTEVLYYHRSTKGQRYAEILNDHLVQVLDLPNRGAKPKAAEDRGGYLLMNTNVPCVIAEPFFIDNNNDLKMAQENRENLVAAYFSAISAIANHI